MNKENELISLCRQLVERLVNWGDSSKWSNQDFESLSDKIFEKTQVRLSVSTLKRIWGKVRYDHSPTLATLNALAKFLNFESWRDFQARHTNQSAERFTENAIIGREIKSPDKRIFRVISMTALVIGGLSIAFLLIKGKTAAIHLGLAKFESRKVSDDLPNSVVFNYEAPALDTDSIFIQQNWDPRRREHVPSSGRQHTSIYYYPGYFQAKLILNRRILKEDVVFIKTKGWKGIVGTKPTPVYLHESEVRLPASLGITRKTLMEKLGSPVFNDVWVTFCNVREFTGLSGTDFLLDLKLKNTSSVEESVCRRVNITLLTKGGAIIVPLAAKGCISDLDLLTGEGWKSGKENDLSGFGCDFLDFEHVVCKVASGQMKIYLNEGLIFEERQIYQLAEIVGVRIAFEGTGEIKEFKLEDPDNVYLEEIF